MHDQDSRLMPGDCTPASPAWTKFVLFLLAAHYKQLPDQKPCVVDIPRRLPPKRWLKTTTISEPTHTPNAGGNRRGKPKDECGYLATGPASVGRVTGREKKVCKPHNCKSLLRRYVATIFSKCCSSSSAGSHHMLLSPQENISQPCLNTLFQCNFACSDTNHPCARNCVDRASDMKHSLREVHLLYPSALSVLSSSICC